MSLYDVQKHCAGVLRILEEPSTTDAEIIAVWLNFIEVLENSEDYNAHEHWGEYYDKFRERYEAAMCGVWLDELV